MFTMRTKLSALAIAAAAGLGMIGSATAAGAAATGTTGPHSSASVGCNRSGPHSAYLEAPTLKAVNRTIATDYQTVVFQPVLFKWNGSAFVEYASGRVLYGQASDARTPSAWYDWTTRANLGNGTTVMTLPGAGYWRAAYRMWWYTGSSVTGSDYLWADGYYVMSPIGAVSSVPYCTT